MNKNNIIFGSISVLGGSIIFWIANGFVVKAGLDPLGPSFYPKMLGVLLIVLGVTLILQNKKTNTEEQELEEEKEETGFWNPGNKRVIGLVGISIAYLFVLESLGFILTNILFIIGIMFINNERKIVKILIASTLTSFVLYLVFKKILGVLLPSFGFI